MTIVKKKQLKNNTYKTITIYLKGGGFGIKFFEPFEDYEEYVKEVFDEIEHETANEKDAETDARKYGTPVNKTTKAMFDIHTKEVIIEQFNKDEVQVDAYGFWRVK